MLAIDYHLREYSYNFFSGGYILNKFIIMTAILMFTIACNGKPKIKFEHKKFDFGEVEQGDNVKHIFTFKNIGDDTLLISKIRAG